MNSFPPGYIDGNTNPFSTPDNDVGPGWGWAALMLPFLEQDNVYRQINFSQGVAVGNNVVISWPTNGATGYVLQSKTIFNSASVWAAVADLPVPAGNRFYVTNSPSGVARFYQLAKIPAAPLPAD